MFEWTSLPHGGFDPNDLGLRDSSEDRKHGGFGTSDRPAPGRTEPRFGVLGDLFGSLEVRIVYRVVVVLAFVGRVITTDLRASQIDPTQVIRLQMLADRMDEQIPITIIDEDGGLVVQQIPSDVIEVLLRRRDIDRQGKITTTLGIAVIAQTLTRRDLRLHRPAPIDRFRNDGQYGSTHEGLQSFRTNKL